MKRGSPDGGRVVSSNGEISSGAACSSGDRLLLVSSDNSALTMTVSRVQQKGQEQAFWSRDLHKLHNAFGAVGSRVTSLLAVITNYGVTGSRVVAGLMTMAESARLSFVPEVDQNFSKAHVVGNRAFNLDTVNDRHHPEHFPIQVHGNSHGGNLEHHNI